MVAIRNSLSKPKFRCILLSKDRKFSGVLEDLKTDLENNNIDDGPCDNEAAPKVLVSTSETGVSFPFHSRISVDQASKMLRSDILWVTFEFPVKSHNAPPTTIRNAFDVLKKAQTTKSSLPIKYPSPINGTFKAFNHLVDLCRESGVFFRYLFIICPKE